MPTEMEIFRLQPQSCLFLELFFSKPIKFFTPESAGREWPERIQRLEVNINLCREKFKTYRLDEGIFGANRDAIGHAKRGGS